jgi:hypothetical protein
VSVFYPGTVRQDYLDWVAAASKGQWAHWFYKRRPYQLG